MLKTTLSDLEKILGVTFKNPNLLIESLTHRSALNEDSKIKQSNERLEFLGDSVLSILTSTELFNRFPDYPEGKLTNLRSTLVRTPTLAKISQSLKFGNYLIMSHGEENSGGRENTSILADAFEAVLGAIYLDQGINVAKKYLETNLFSQIDQLLQDASLTDYKSKLQEITQNRHKLAPIYKVTQQTGPDHNKTFTVSVSVGTKFLAEGCGKSKQEAEQEAARIALQNEKL